MVKRLYEHVHVQMHVRVDGPYACEISFHMKQGNHMSTILSSDQLHQIN